MRPYHFIFAIFLTLGPGVFSARSANYWTWDCESADYPWFNRFYASSGLVTTEPRSGERCVQIDVIGNDGGNQGRGTDVKSIVLGNVQQGQWFYYRWWMKLGSGFSWGTGTAKTKASRLKCTEEQMIRLWTGYIGHGSVHLDESDVLAPSWDPAGVRVPYDFRAAAGTGWHEYIVAMKMQTGAAGSDGEFHFYVDGSWIGGKTGIHYIDFADSCSEAWNGWMVSPYFQLNGTAADGGTLWLDDYSMDDCWNSAIYPDPNASSVPSVPTGLSSVAVSSTTIGLTWTSSTDDVAVTGYRIYRDGVEVGTTPTNSYNDIGLSPATPYIYRVAAYDAAGNQSELSGPVTVTTSASSNHAPVLTPIGNRSIPAGQRFQFTVEAADADGDTLQYSASGGR